MTNPFEVINARLQNIEALILDLHNKPANQEEQDRWFDIDELCDYLPGKPIKPTIYRWVKQGYIPAKKFGSRLGFLKSEIDLWLKEKHRIVNKEIQGEDCLKGKK